MFSVVDKYYSLHLFGAGNNYFSLFTGYVTFQILLLVEHFTNWTTHNLLTHNTLKRITQDVLVGCLVVVSNHNVKLSGHFQNLVGQCKVTNSYFKHCFSSPTKCVDSINFLVSLLY